MAPTLTSTQKDIVSAMLAAKTRPEEIAVDVQCSVRTVQRIKRNLKNFNQVTAPILSVQGRPRLIHQEAIEVCRSFLFLPF